MTARLPSSEKRARAPDWHRAKGSDPQGPATRPPLPSPAKLIRTSLSSGGDGNECRQGWNPVGLGVVNPPHAPPSPGRGRRAGDEGTGVSVTRPMLHPRRHLALTPTPLPHPGEGLFGTASSRSRFPRRAQRDRGTHLINAPPVIRRTDG